MSSASSTTADGKTRPPKLSYVFDWRLVASLVLLALTAVMSCDVVNRQASTWFQAPAQPGPNRQAWVPGGKDRVDLTVVTSDAAQLACAHERSFEDRHCEFKKDKKRWPRPADAPLDDNKRTVIQPYRTAVGNYLVLIAGLWHTPAVALRLHQEPARGIAQKKLKRFVVRCDLRFLGQLNEAEVRWNPSQKWYAEKNAPVAVAEDCDVLMGEL